MVGKIYEILFSNSTVPLIPWPLLLFWWAEWKSDEREGLTISQSMWFAKCENLEPFKNLLDSSHFKNVRSKPFQNQSEGWVSSQKTCAMVSRFQLSSNSLRRWSYWADEFFPSCYNYYFTKWFSSWKYPALTIVILLTIASGYVLWFHFMPNVQAEIFLQAAKSGDRMQIQASIAAGVSVNCADQVRNHLLSKQFWHWLLPYRHPLFLYHIVPFLFDLFIHLPLSLLPHRFYLRFSVYVGLKFSLFLTASSIIWHLNHLLFISIFLSDSRHNLFLSLCSSLSVTLFLFFNLHFSLFLFMWPFLCRPLLSCRSLRILFCLLLPLSLSPILACSIILSIFYASLSASIPLLHFVLCISIILYIYLTLFLFTQSLPRPTVCPLSLRR